MMKTFFRRIALVLMIVGGILFYTMMPHWNSAFGEAVKVLDNEISDKTILTKGTALDMELFLIMESFCGETVQTTRNGAVTSTSEYEYVTVPFIVGEETYYLGMKLSETQYKRASKVINDTMDYLYGEDVDFANTFVQTASIVKMDEEAYGYFQDWFIEMDWFESQAEIEKYVLPLLIDTVDPDYARNALIASIVLFVCGVVIVGLTFVAGMKYAKRAKILAKCEGSIVTSRHTTELTFPVKNLDDVDKAVWKGDFEKAKKLLVKSYWATEEEAADYVARWAELTSSEELNN